MEYASLHFPPRLDVPVTAVRHFWVQATVFVLIALGAQHAVAQQTTVHFTAAGDYKDTPEATSVLQGIAGAQQDFHIALGDLQYGRTGEEQQWCDMVTSVVGTTLPFELISGNHESEGLTGNIDTFAQCLPNKLPNIQGTYGRQWYVDVPAEAPIMRIILSSPGLRTPDGVKHTYEIGTPEYDWLSATIDDAHAAGLKWVVSAMHYPCFSIGVYSCVMGRDTMDLLVSKKVDLVLMGHEHNYSRTYQLGYGTGCEDRTILKPSSFNAACIRDSDSAMVKGAGTVFAIVGTGGTTLRDLDTTDPEAPYFAAASGLNSNPTWGFLNVTATATELTADVVPTIGTFTDSFTVTDPTAPDPGTGGGTTDPGTGGGTDPGTGGGTDPGTGGGTDPGTGGGTDPGTGGATTAADRDGDGVPDETDACPGRQGPTDRLGCPVQVTGSAGNDVLYGSRLNDIIEGLEGSDRLVGGLDNDILKGGPGNDILVGGPGVDALGGGPGNDVIRARDGLADRIFCSGGTDVVVADAIDVTSGCERILVP